VAPSRTDRLVPGGARRRRGGGSGGRLRPAIRSGALGFLAAGAPALLVASLLPGRGAAWVFTLVAGAFPVALMALGAVRRGPGPGEPAGRPGGPAWVLLALLVVLVGTSAGILVLAGGPAGPAPAPASAGLAGLPFATVIQVVGLWLLPLPLAALGYALTFGRAGVTGEDLARLRRRAGSSQE